MGEVYRARDTRLDRTVAVKILPSHLSEDAEARQRFDREARTISSVNHPNICTLHDVGHQDGIDYLVMEYLEGETLAERLRKGPLAIEQVYRYGIDICEGLEKAHRSGVVHRDLKPGNIMLTKSGAKLLDFGLAKAALGGPANSGLTATFSAPLGNTPLTAQGAVVGTFQYMSPEQVEGKEAEARSDIFALGAVLYEMATGKRAFEGKTGASAMAAVLEREPAPISSVQPMAPLALERLVKGCLAKDPDERWQTAHDVKLQLRHMAEGGSQISTAAATELVATPRKRGNWLAWVVAGVFGALAVAALMLAYLAAQKQAPVLRVELLPPETTQFNLSGDNAGPAMISPDGRYVVFSAMGANGSQLYLRTLDAVAAKPLPGTENATFPFWSPDSRSIAFFTEDKLKRLEVTAGAPVTICDAVLGRGGSWNQDGTIVAALSYNSGIAQVPASGGTPTAITKVDNVTYSSDRWPWFLPDGKHFLYSAVNHNAPTSTDTGVFLASLDGKENRLLLRTLSNAVYVSGYLLYERENSLVAQPFDASKGKFTGEPQPLSATVGYDAGLWRANLSVSANGMMVYASGSATGFQRLTWFDRAGKVLGTVGEPGGFFDIDLSPDEKKLAITEANNVNALISVEDLGSQRRTRLTFDGGTHKTPVWSPDGTEMAFTSKQDSQIAIKSVTTNAPERVLLTSADKNFQGISDWSRDGKYLLFEQGGGIDQQQIWVLPLGGDGKPYRYANGEIENRDGTFSPDGRWIAYMSNEVGRPEVFVAPFPWTGAKWQITNGGGALPRWREDGKELYYYDFSGIAAAEVDGSGAAFRVGGSKHLFALTLRALRREYAPSRDGQKFIAIAAAGGGVSQSLTLVQNWAAELKK
jgi:Tol biopolymer transport system component